MSGDIRRVNMKFGVVAEIIQILFDACSVSNCVSGVSNCVSTGVKSARAGVKSARAGVKSASAGARTRELESLLLEVSSSQTNFAISAAPLYLLINEGESVRENARIELERTIAAGNYLPDLDSALARACKIAEIDLSRTKKKKRGDDRKKKTKGGLGRAVVQKVLGLYSQYVGSGRAAPALRLGSENYTVCEDCAVEMSLKPETSELECFACGRVFQLVGTVFDEAQFYSQDNQKAKSGSFNPNRHYGFWMDHTLAREPGTELGDKNNLDNQGREELVAQLRGMMKRDRIIPRLLTVNRARTMLKEIGRTDLNKNVPLIMKKLTGHGPPQIAEEICQRVEMIFTKAIEISERIRDPEKTNRNYYPYYTYKILDAILPPDDLANRRVLYYIYMQKPATISKNDSEWRKICAELPDELGIRWVATDRSKALQYRPSN